MEPCHCESKVDGASGKDGSAPPRRPGRAARVGLAVLVLGAGTALAAPLYHGWRSSGCQPRNWIDWHLAMRRQCLAPSYVCENMTTARMLDDPDVAAAYRSALASGSRDPVPGLEEMVGRMRLSYGCAPERAARVEAPEIPEGHPAALPPGHPPIPRGLHSFGFESAPTTTL
jgi:hypothetical protein